jgi:signal transduction histidine kinase
VAVADIVADALASFDAVKVGSEVELCVKVEPNLVVFGDRAALAQAVGNLLGNAWKYTPSQGKKIDLVAASDAKHITITVGDNGEGIKVAEEKEIFEKFSRGSAAKQGGSQGSGLGLAIVRAVVEAHQGKVDVKSDRRPRGALPHRASPPKRGRMSELTPGPLVAIVEDDEAIAEGLALNLKLQGYRTEVMGDGETARKRIEAGAPDLVLLDISLPKQSGLWVLERLREAEDHVPGHRALGTPG